MNKYRILIVEDEALIAASLVHALSSLGYTVLEPVATGEDAIRAVKTQKPDLVLMDIVLIGEMNGIVAAEKIRAIADIPVIYLTAYTDDLRLKQARLTEPYGYIVKPAQNRELNATIEMALYKHALDRKLKESEETFKALAENANDGILVSVADGAYTYANIRAGEITGYSVAELLKTSIMDLAAPDEVKNLMEMFRKRLAGEDIPQQYETLIIHKDGKSVPIEFTAAKTFWHGQPADLVIIRDITERKLAEEALRKERDFADSVVGTAQAIIMVLDMKGHIVYLNPYMEEISGYILEEVKGKDWFETFLPSHIQESTRSLFLKAVWDIQTCGNVNAIITRDGRERLIEWHDKTLKNADGSIEGLLAIGHDVTDQKQMEEALRKSEEKYRGLIEQTGEGVWIIDRDYRTTFVNNRLAAMFGYTLQEMTGKQLQEFMPAGDMEVHSRRIRERLEGKSDRFEQKFIRKDGSVLWVIASVTPWLAEENRLVGTFAMLTDITERKRMEDVLRESEMRYRALIDNALEAILIFDFSGTVLFANHATAVLVEVDNPRALTGRNALEFVAPESRDAVLADFVSVGEGRDACLAQYKIITATGRELWVESTGKKIQFGGVPAALVMLRNITDRKRAETALHESEERYRILADAAHDAIYTLSPEGVVTYVNSGGFALTGMPPEKIVGLSLESLYRPEIAQELRANLDTVISTKRPVRYDLKFWHENPDQVTWLDAQLVPQFGPDGSVVQVIGISRSITDRKQAEMLLKRFNEELESQVCSRTAELEHINILLENEVFQRTQAEESVRKSLDERELLLREIHHRVRNNLQIILSLIALQSRIIKDQKLLETMGEFRNRIMAMAHVHERMCRADDISRIELSEICTFLKTSLFRSYKVDPQHIRLNVEMKDLLITIESAIPLSLILNELISNSIKHAFPKGTTGEITIAGRREADTLVLSFRDTGIGIPEDLDWMRSTQSLGLRLVVNLVEQLDGTIDLDRSAGTAFVIVVKEKE